MLPAVYMSQHLSRNIEERAKRDKSGERKARAEKAEQSGRSLLTSEIQTGVEAGNLVQTYTKSNLGSLVEKTFLIWTDLK